MSEIKQWATWYTDDSRTVVLNRVWMSPVSEDDLWSNGPVTDLDLENWEEISAGPGKQSDRGFLWISHVRRR